MSTKHPIIGGHATGIQDGTHARVKRADICTSLIGVVLTVALLAAVARGVVAVSLAAEHDMRGIGR
jgi:hypothetical protein